MKAAEKEARRAFIGASDAAAILGVDRWKKPIDIYMEKIGATEPVDDEEEGPGAWGRFLERVIVARWMDVSGLPLSHKGKRTRNFVHPQYDFIRATPDAYAVGPIAKGRGPGKAPLRPVLYVVEAKTARTANGWGEPLSDEIPRGYKVQAIVQSAVTGAPVVHVPVLIGGQDFRRYIVEPTDEQREAVIAALVEFWTENVQKRVEPPDVSEEFVRWKWPEDSGEDLVATDGDTKLVESYRRARTNREQAEAAEEEAKLAIMARIGNRSRMLGPGFVISWKKTKDVETTNWPSFADGMRRWIEDAFEHYELEELGLERPDLDTLRSIHTSKREGSRVFRPTFHEEEEAR